MSGTQRLSIQTYSGQKDLAHEWARKHRIKLVARDGVLRVIETADDLGVVGESEERSIEVSGLQGEIFLP